MRSLGHLFTCFLISALLALGASAGEERELGEYRYGSTWWEEYSDDGRTLLLLHFGREQPCALDALAPEGLAQRTKRKEHKTFGDDLMGEDDSGDDLGSDAPMQLNYKDPRVKKVLPRVKEPVLPKRIVLDYSRQRRKVPLGAGMKVVPEGRFGAGISFDGSGSGLAIKDLVEGRRSGSYSAPFNMVECWIKIESYPKKPACVFSAGGDECRLMLRPDGKVELVRRHPYGKPMKAMYERQKALAEYERIFQSPAAMISKEPIPVGQWVHVAAGRSTSAVVEAHLGWVWVNGREVASYQGSKWNPFNWFGSTTGDQTFTLGNDRKGEAPFKGVVDELRVSLSKMYFGLPSRFFNHKKTYPWRDVAGSRPLRFGKPYFLQDGTVFHLSFTKGLQFDFHKAGLKATAFERKVSRQQMLFADGVHGKGLILDPRVSLLRIPAKGLSMREGAIEFWVKPLNWDNGDISSPKEPAASISLLRVVCAKAGAHGDDWVYFRMGQSRSHSAEHTTDFHPGTWTHCCLVWNSAQKQHRFYLYKNHAHRWKRARTFWLRDKGLQKLSMASLKPLYLEFGVGEPKARGSDDREPRIVVDEIVGHKYALSSHEITQAYQRVQKELEPIRFFDLRPHYKYSIAELTASLETMLPPDVTPKDATISVLDPEGKSLAPPVTQPIKEEKASFVLSQGKPLYYGPVTFKVQVRDTAGKTVVDEMYKGWRHRKEPWRGNTIGLLSKTPAPWTPIEIQARTLKTRMTTYELGEDGLPHAIINRGENLLASPVRLLEDGKPMQGGGLKLGPSQDVKAEWSSSFQGATCSIKMGCRIEYDGLIRYELKIEPKGKVGRISFEIPMKAEHATHRMFQRGDCWNRLLVRKADPAHWTPRMQALPGAARHAKYKRKPIPDLKTLQTYAYWSQMDLCSRDRGLYWFADNLAGWHQSPAIAPQEFRLEGKTHTMAFHLVTEPAEYKPTRPIVFGILPHPARPVPGNHRYWDRKAPPDDPLGKRLYGSTFFLWTKNPKAGDMKLYPARHPDQPDKGASWAYAESCRASMKELFDGYRTFYCSIGYAGGRAGSYDQWEWRNAGGSRISLTKSFNEYATWEINEWIKRDIYDAIYVDDSYAVVCSGEKAVKAGQAIRLPNGKIQSGARIWDFRELMKRWRNVFLAHGKRPMLLIHHSNHWMYPGMVFAESALDGEGCPTITVRGGRDFVDSMSLTRAEALQNQALWGISRYFMASIWEFGPLAKGENPHPAWSWRMARGAQSLLAHFENPVVYADQGGSVYNAYWHDLLAWGGGDVEKAEFVPYWHADPYLKLEGQGSKALVSIYKQSGKVFLVASNRTKKNVDMKITLDLKALGLASAQKVKALDSAYVSPKGIDPWLLRKHTKKELKGGPQWKDLDSADDEDLEDLTLEEKKPAVDPARVASSKPPVLKDGVLTVPVRAHDFRVVTLE